MLLKFTKLPAALAILAALAGCADEKPAGPSASSKPVPREVRLLVGTYTEGPASSGKSKGIPVFRFDTTTGEASHLTDNDGIRNPSWLVVSDDAKHVYAVNELNGTGKSGEVSAFNFDAANGRLLFTGKISSGGDDPCHLLLDERRGLLFASNYTSGTMRLIGTFPNLIGPMGVGPMGTFPEIKSAPFTEQPGSHLHSTASFPGDSGFITQDLGRDTLTFIPCDQPDLHWKTIALPANTGPRHLIFDTAGKYAYLTGELNDSVTVMKNTFSTAGARNEKDFPLAPMQTVTLGSPVEPGKGTAAAIHLSDDGKFLYASTRNPKNILVVFAVNPADGTLREIQTVSSGGKAPREFAIAPGGKFLLVANQQSDAIAVFTRDPETGKITDTGRRIEVGSPTDLKWAPAK